MIDGAVGHRAVHIRVSSEQCKKENHGEDMIAYLDSWFSFFIVLCLYVIRYAAFIHYSISTITPQLG